MASQPFACPYNTLGISSGRRIVDLYQKKQEQDEVWWGEMSSQRHKYRIGKTYQHGLKRSSCINGLQVEHDPAVSCSSSGITRWYKGCRPHGECVCVCKNQYFLVHTPQKIIKILIFLTIPSCYASIHAKYHAECNKTNCAEISLS